MIETNLTINNEIYAIGWVEFAKCQTNDNTFSYFLNVTEIKMLAHLGHSVKITPANGDITNYTVISKPNNYVIHNLRNGDIL